MKEMRWQVWQRDETAGDSVQTLTVPSHGFWRVFAISLARERSTTSEFRAMAAFECSLFLNTSSCKHDTLRPLAARAVAALSWNGHVDHRVTSRRARDGWSKWIGRVAEEEKWRFDLGEEEQMKIIEAENIAEKALAESDTKTAAVANRTVRLLKEAYIATASAASRAERDKYVARTGFTVVGRPIHVAHTNGQVDEGQVKVIETSLVLGQQDQTSPTKAR